MSASEALCNLFGFDTANKIPVVVRLDEHLENHRACSLSEGKEAQTAGHPRVARKLIQCL